MYMVYLSGPAQDCHGEARRVVAIRPLDGEVAVCVYILYIHIQIYTHIHIYVSIYIV